LEKCVENDGDFMDKSLVIAKDVRIIPVNFIILEIAFSEKNLGALLSYRPS
jgi:hypothetical protein